MGRSWIRLKYFFRYFYCNIEMVKTAEQKAKILEVRANVKANGGVYKPTGKPRGAPPGGHQHIPVLTKAAKKQKILELRANIKANGGVYKPTGKSRGRPRTV